MCYTTRNPVPKMNTSCECDCGCPVLLPIEDEIRKLEEHKKNRVAQIEAIDKKIAALRSVKEQ